MSRKDFLAESGGLPEDRQRRGNLVKDLPVAGDELATAFIAVEAFQVKHRVAGPHDQFVRGYLVAATPADAAIAEQSATKSEETSD